ncbi:uncharacterized protein [Pocillopora verrucosa]
MLQQYYFEKMKKSFITMIQNLCTIDYQLKTIQNQLQRSPATEFKVDHIILVTNYLLYLTELTTKQIVFYPYVGHLSNNFQIKPC